MPPLKLERMFELDQLQESVKMLDPEQPKVPFDFDFSGTDLTLDQINTVQHLLSEFSDIFSLGPNDLGCTALLRHTIDTSSARPILQRPRRLPIHI